jgi:Predicted endonuclease involved in recombination (possible Holliday junction resolvase in Mycoplasmas and B. subtilis)
MRILGVDYGDRHIGLALSDPLGMIAQPLETYTLKDKKPRTPPSSAVLSKPTGSSGSSSVCLFGWTAPPVPGPKNPGLRPLA